ncbi:hypothetical protein MMINT_04150 [Candidatus Methanomassiliicoccus intestinalis Issoire-Mx1]|uniref:Uncharacterized protein n=1 Tax=Methanomassiliicoccus intestinalis (strain Issoire-Mx1) TaxID=1295009 RepID=R9T8V7_METII|nr:hypothetical protein MMINT_04150 [Candidatus Methanomassiliicoccus intestinalis Issoire-Mx1]
MIKTTSASQRVQIKRLNLKAGITGTILFTEKVCRCGVGSTAFSRLYNSTLGIISSIRVLTQ